MHEIIKIESGIKTLEDLAKRNDLFTPSQIFHLTSTQKILKHKLNDILAIVKK